MTEVGEPDAVPEIEIAPLEDPVPRENPVKAPVEKPAPVRAPVREPVPA